MTDMMEPQELRESEVKGVLQGYQGYQV